MPRPNLLGHLITLLTSFLFFYGGQAHLTDAYTPELARRIEVMSEGCAKAWWWFGLDAEPVRPLLIPLVRQLGSTLHHTVVSRHSILNYDDAIERPAASLRLALRTVWTDYAVAEIFRNLRLDNRIPTHHTPNFS
jgi:hypothetical protein